MNTAEPTPAEIDLALAAIERTEIPHKHRPSFGSWLMCASLWVAFGAVGLPVAAVALVVASVTTPFVWIYSKARKDRP